MRGDLLHPPTVAEGPLHRLDARLKILSTVAIVILVVLTPFRWWPGYVVEGAIIVGAYALSRLPWRLLAVRLAVLLPFLLLVAGSVVLAQASSGRWELAAQVLIRALLALTAMITLVSTTPLRSLLGGLGRLGMPRILLSIVAFMHRYAFVLADELSRMRRARQARTFRPSLRGEIAQNASFVGILFVRAFERAERIDAAMRARGGTGELHLDEDAEG